MRVFYTLCLFLLLISPYVNADKSDSTYTRTGIFSVNLGRYDSLIEPKIIDTQSQYDSIITALQEKYTWLEETPPVIDFNRFVLTGDESWADCVASFSYDVEIDTLSNTYIITIIEHYGGGCGMNVFRHWFLIPKLPQEYSIEFIHKEGKPKYHYED
ncbi:MAG: hypothetical protein JW794_07720 [Candidatus Cloacimonetes bacterium]|nr:hypothetical protein [Candidatus Cloacimonadota bacterium]